MILLAILGLALIFYVYLYLHVVERAEAAEAARDKARAETRRVIRDARATAATARYYRERLAKYQLTEDQQFASLPRDVKTVTDVDEFLNDLLGGH